MKNCRDLQCVIQVLGDMNVVCDQMHQTVTIREYEILNLALYSV